LNSVCD